ncbi:hypothetical protein EBZ80_11255 [bacterium]|nr:hypothetical protein [bacterium]
MRATFERVAVAAWISGLAAAAWLAPEGALALPISFGRNQGDLEFSEASDQDFVVYFDRETPEEGRFTLRALRLAQPRLERWFGVKRDATLPVVLSSVTDGASFANFITDALEIQSMGQGDRALVWHEYTHAMMYRHLRNIFGPPGAILHLPWMPVWFIEGLAEATSVSVGSDFQAGVERYQALTGEWPSYDRMHSLYGSSFAARGYAVSGAFVTWLIRKQGAARLPEILARFRDRSMPWWWPWAAVPFNGFMPMDDSLGTPGRALFEAYKADALARHRRVEGDQAMPVAASARGQGALVMNGMSGSAIATAMTTRGIYDAKSGWLTSLGAAEPRRPVSSDPRDPYLNAWRHTRAGENLIWMEQRKNVTRFCRAPVDGSSAQATCPVEARFPQSIEWLGWDPVDSRMYLTRKTHTLTRDRYEILVWEPGDKIARPARVDPASAGEVAPVALARNGDDLVMVVAGRQHRHLVLFNPANGNCRGMHRMVDLPLGMESLPGGGSAIALWTPAGTVARRWQPGQVRREFPMAGCSLQTGPTSPLLEAARAAEKNPSVVVGLDDALSLAAAGPQQTPQQEREQEPEKSPGPPADEIEVRDAKWRGRGVLAFPWIGADDALGPQFGFVSVPLMDHLQNETVRLSFLVGAQSRYPNTDLRLISTRWRPTISAAAFRQQTYNGVMVVSPEGERALSYLDEAGFKFDGDISWRVGSSTVALGTGLKYSSLKPYLGPSRVRSGNLAELSSTVTASTPLGGGRHSISEALYLRLAPAAINEDFDYNALGAQVNLSVDPRLWKSRLGLGLEGSRTRGKKTRELKEVYRPLRTFVPGSGGGYNQNSFGLAGEGWLFAGRYGDTQGRLKADWTVPLVEDFEKLLWIFYVDRLDFSAFLNYGGAWNSSSHGAIPPADRLFGAHGYNLDLQLDNKGVRFNVGGGVGQVFDKPWEAYLTAGFDALF